MKPYQAYFLLAGLFGTGVVCQDGHVLHKREQPASQLEILRRRAEAKDSSPVQNTAGATAAVGAGQNNTDSEANLAASKVDREQLQAHIEALDQIAQANNGNRADNTTGFNASVAYVQDSLAGLDNLRTEVKQVPYTQKTINKTLSNAQGESIRVDMLSQNTFMSDPAGVSAPLVAMPINLGGSSCSEDQYGSLNVTDKIVLIRRGGCPYGRKVKLAMEKGARAVILDNSKPEPYFFGTLGRGAENTLIPTLTVSLELGNELREKAAGNTLAQPFSMILYQKVDELETTNVIAETSGGDPDNVIILGAHLDGVPEGPGINDNGSGSSALIEVARTLANSTGPKNKIRFAWWGAEETNLWGSRRYVETLEEAERNKIRYYYNLDMLGSPNSKFFVQSMTPEDEFGASKLLDYVKRANTTVDEGPFGVDSDFFHFVLAKIPSAALTTGSSPEADPCYHQACDNKDNINMDALELSTKAVAYAAVSLGNSLEGLAHRSSFNLRRKRSVDARRKRNAGARKSCTDKEAARGVEMDEDELKALAALCGQTESVVE